MPKEDKATTIIYEQRVAKILPLISFMNVNEIFRYVSEKENWNISKRQLENYVADARKLLSSEVESFKKNAVANVYNNYVNLYKKALKKEDHKLCLQIQDSIAKLFGLNQINLDLTTKGEKINSFTVKIESDEI